MLRLVFFSMFMLAIGGKRGERGTCGNQIVTTILPLEGLVRAVGGTHISVETLAMGAPAPTICA